MPMTIEYSRVEHAEALNRLLGSALHKFANMASAFPANADPDAIVIKSVDGSVEITVGDFIEARKVLEAQIRYEQ